jgi:two-component system, OmpR family, sensor kinase
MTGNDQNLPGSGAPEEPPAGTARAPRAGPRADSGQPRTALGRWLARRTLRGRLVAGLLTLLFLVCASIGTLTYAHLHSVLIGQLNSQLEAASKRYVDCMMPPPDSDHDDHGPDHDGDQPPGVAQPGSADDCAQQQASGTINATFAHSGDLLTAHQADSNQECYLSPADRALLTSLPIAGMDGTGQPRTVELSGHGEYQVLARRTAQGVLVTGLPLSPVNSTLREVALAEIAVFAVALVLAGVIGTAWVRVSLRPLRRVAATATRVTQVPLASGEVNLPERVPDTDPRTEVGQLGAAFNRMLGHVESALARRQASESRLRSFAADASHELRTPLAAIRGYAELARRYRGPLPEDVEHALGRVLSESARMSELVDELLLLARLDAGRPLASEPVDMTRLVLDATSDARVAAPDHRWQLDLPDEPVLVRGDEQRLRQVLANLLSNAARHTPPGTNVVASVAMAPGKPGSGPGVVPPASTGGGGLTAVISVTDDGPGIPADLQPSVFERFVRGDESRSRAAGGSGLGLSIVHAVTAAHGGQAQLTSRPGQTRFTITLPAIAQPGSQDTES